MGMIHRSAGPVDVNRSLRIDQWIGIRRCWVLCLLAWRGLDYAAVGLSISSYS